jgi:hypothetical protein
MSSPGAAILYEEPPLDANAFSFSLDSSATAELRRIATQTGVPPSDLVGVALRMLSIAVEAKSRKRRVLVTSKRGYPIEEITIAA